MERFQPSHLVELVEALETHPERWRLEHYIVVVGCGVSPAVVDRALRLGEQRGHPVAVWTWEAFADRLVEHVGQGPYLSRSALLRARTEWARGQQARFEAAPILAPGSVPPGRALPRLHEVYLPRTVTRSGQSQTLRSAVLGHRQKGELIVLLGETGAGKSTALL